MADVAAITKASGDIMLSIGLNAKFDIS